MPAYWVCTGCLLLPSGLRGRPPGEGNMEAESLGMKNKEAASRELRLGLGGREVDVTPHPPPPLRTT